MRNYKRAKKQQSNRAGKVVIGSFEAMGKDFKKQYTNAFEYLNIYFMINRFESKLNKLLINEQFLSKVHRKDTEEILNKVSELKIKTESLEIVKPFIDMYDLTSLLCLLSYVGSERLNKAAENIQEEFTEYVTEEQMKNMGDAIQGIKRGDLAEDVIIYIHTLCDYTRAIKDMAYSENYNESEALMFRYSIDTIEKLCNKVSDEIDASI